MAKNLENRIQKAGAILEITSKLPQVRDISYSNMLNQTLKSLTGIPQNIDIEKRQIAKDILSNRNSDFRDIFFIISNGNQYFEEPFSEQQSSHVFNFAFRDYFQGVIKTNDTYLGQMVTTTAASGVRGTVIAVPVYSLKDNSTIVGLLGGGINHSIWEKELRSLNMTLDNNARIVYVDNIGQKVADSDINKNKSLESFASLRSFKNAMSGQSGSIIDALDNTKMLVTYQPVKAFHNTYAVLLMQPLQ